MPARFRCRNNAPASKARTSHAHFANHVSNELIPSGLASAFMPAATASWMSPLYPSAGTSFQSRDRMLSILCQIAIWATS